MDLQENAIKPQGTSKKMYYLVGSGVFAVLLIGLVAVSMMNSSSPSLKKTRVQPASIPPATLTPTPTISMETKYDNPFDQKSQYQNPFSSSENYKNPFDLEE